MMIHSIAVRLNIHVMMMIIVMMLVVMLLILLMVVVLRVLWYMYVITLQLSVIEHIVYLKKIPMFYVFMVKIIVDHVLVVLVLLGN